METSMSRRGFVTASALAAGTAFIAANGKKAYADAAPVPETWDLEADVVVVGFGGAGASAAIAAGEAGAKVIVLEKANEQDCGGNFSVAGGSGILANPDDPEMAFNFLKFQMPTVGTNDEELRGFVDESLATPQWLEDHNFDGVVTFNEEGGGSMYSANEYAHGWNGTMSGVGAGYGFFQWLKGVCESNENIEIHYETPGVKLIFDPTSKEVYGVLAMDAEGSPVNVLARRGVVLALGGFENNPEMLTAYYPPEVPIYPLGTPYNTGDGMKMINEVGAKLRGFGSVEWGCHCNKIASEETGVAQAFDFVGPQSWDHAIMVNKDGKRFVAESNSPVASMNDFIIRPLHEKSQLPELAFSMETLSYTNLPMFFICDQSRVDAGALCNGSAESAVHYWSHKHDWYTWSDDNQAEIEKGWVIKADTIEELAEKLGIDPSGLADQVARYNEGCASGDDEFGRTVVLSPVETGPFYGFELGLGIINTQGGPVRNEKYQVVSYDDEVIPRLYAGGEFGSMYTWLYQGSGNVAECIHSRGAGANAAAEEPWC